MLADRRTPGPVRLLAGAGLLACGAAGAPVHAQNIEPRAYAPAPTGVNFLVLAYVGTRGGLSTDNSTPLKDPHLAVQGPILGYARTFGLLGQLAKFDAIVPSARLSGSATFQGQPVERQVSGLMDPLVRLSVNLVGSPALALEEFRSYRQDVIVGASLQVSLPLGQYDNTRLVNLSANRWAFHPEIGVSKAMDRWVLELATGAVLYTTNKDFFGGQHRHQDPILTARANAIYNFRSGPWLSVDTSYFTGGETTLDGRPENNLQRNWRVGTTFAYPVNPSVSVKLNASRGVSARTGNNFDLLGVALQYRWGGGL
ncbi:transporter [Ramlibacter monticola]|uniref:Transporter n=1 Tax=Ramlibacter monticola TaxID=1926872 RepID=A0A936Z096_9BURK|nr:transporter [Ramlibacter monticola]MBL0391147.1 transporter [Ramlibacter monticola]